MNESKFGTTGAVVVSQNCNCSVY